MGDAGPSGSRALRRTAEPVWAHMSARAVFRLPGRAACRLAGPAAATLLAACVAAGPGDPPSPSAAVPRGYPPIEAGGLASADQASAEQLLRVAREALAAEDYAAAGAAAGQVAERHAGARGASEALWIAAVSAHEQGRHEAAAATAADLAALLGPQHPAFAQALDLGAEALFESNRFLAAAEATLRLPASAYAGSAAARLDSAVSRLDRDELTRLAAAASDDAPPDDRFAPVLAQLALVSAYAADTAAARSYAERARRAGASGRAARVAAAVLDGDMSEIGAAPVIGAVLPVTGSPSNRTYAQAFLEGVEVASASARRAGLPVTVAVEDNRGTAPGTARGVRALASRNAVAILGPLRDENLSEAARVKPAGVPLFSPTAQRVPGSGSVYSAGAASPLAARTLAQTLAGLGHDTAVVLHGSGHGESLEARVFAGAFAEAGGWVAQHVAYPSGATTFLEPLAEVESLAPQLLVVLSSPKDLELLSPQMSFMGFDTLGIQVAGTFAWTSPDVVRSVAHRHLDRVIAVSPFPPGDPGAAGESGAAFRAAYESRFRKTLQSDVPAVGFDLFCMALAAYGDGTASRRGTARAAERLRRFRGVTGTFSVVDGRLEREAFPVLIFEGEFLPVDAELPEDERRPPPPGGSRE